MREYQPLRFNLGQMRLKRFQAEVVLHDLVVIIGLGNEEIGVACRGDQRLRPFGVGAVGDDAAFGLNAIGQKRTAGFTVYHRRRRDVHRAERPRLLRLEHDNRQIEALPCFGGILEQRFHHLRQPRLDSFRPRDNKRTGPAGELGVEQQKRQPAEMIAVKMRDQNKVDSVARDILPLQGRQR